MDPERGTERGCEAQTHEKRPTGKNEGSYEG